MIFRYENKRFKSDLLSLWWNKGVYIGAGKKMMKLQNWKDARDLSSKLKEILGEALLYKKRRHYGTDLVVFPDEGEWTLWYKKRSITMSDVALKQLPIMLGYFCKKYHKLMLDYNNCLLKDGFEIDTTNAYYRRDKNATGL